MDAAKQGATALSAGDFLGAIKHYTDGISQNPQAVDYYIKRSTAYNRVTPPNPLLALLDAETAVVLAHARGKRELISQAQLRRGVALFSAERWADAGQCFEWARKLAPKENSLAIWEAKVQDKLKDLPQADERRQATVAEMPDMDVDGVVRAAKEASGSAPTPKPAEKPVATEAKAEGVQTPVSKIRHDWYQSPETVTVTLMVKGVPRDKTTVDIRPQSLAISFPLPTGSEYDFSLEPLFARIDASASTYKIMSTKVEFILRKTTPGQKWSSLEGTEPLPDGATASDADLSIKRAVLNPLPPQGPSYPTSSRSGPKNWDKLADDLTKKKDKKAEGGEDDFNYDGEEEGDPVNGFFKKLYKDADPNTRRAMMKSYQESNGTALSTNWSEVGAKTVETSPPDGMVAKKWGE